MPNFSVRISQTEIVETVESEVRKSWDGRCCVRKRKRLEAKKELAKEKVGRRQKDCEKRPMLQLGVKSPRFCQNDSWNLGGMAMKLTSQLIVSDPVMGNADLGNLVTAFSGGNMGRVTTHGWVRRTIKVLYCALDNMRCENDASKVRESVQGCRGGRSGRARCWGGQCLAANPIPVLQV